MVWTVPRYLIFKPVFNPVRIAFGLCALAFLLRLAAVVIAPGHFWAYTVYYGMAQTLAGGGGWCLSPGLACAYFPPVYPSILATGILTGHPVPAIAIAGALAGAGTVWFVWLIARHLFGTTTGLLAAAYAALYPYFVWHDAVLQETGTLAFVVTVTVFLLVRGKTWIITGAMLALTVLTKANLLLFIPAALLWIAVTSSLRRLLWTTLGVALLLSPWVARTWYVTGSPILYSNGGFALWTAQHRRTFDYFPQQSIDEASNSELEELPPAQRQQFDPVTDPNGVRRSAWFWNQGIEFIKAGTKTNPGLTLQRAVYKVWIAFSPVFSPAQSAAFEAVYFLSYFPLFVLSGIGAWRARGQWRELGFIYMLMLTFAIGTAVFWGHTSHRMYLEPCLIILSARAVISTST